MSEQGPSFQDRLPLSRSAVDRDGLGRERPDLLEALWADASTRVLPLRGRGALLRADTRSPILQLLPPAGVPADAPRYYLGRTLQQSADGPVGTAVVAVQLDEQAAVALAADDDRWADLRFAGAQLDDRDAGLFTQALALANWHAANAFSPRTGVPTVVGRAGWVRHPEGLDDEASGEHVFPRTDPAIIVGVVDELDRILLASNVAWPQDRFSVLAGFVEPGESFEAAVEREVAEESGVVVTGTTYLGSQPWPFPASVMIGFLAQAAPGQPTPVADGGEIREVRWFSRDDLVAAIEGGLRLPGHTSIARAIIEHWYGGRLEGDW